MKPELAVIFDLDDTLYKEIDFLVSAFRAISVQVEKDYGVSGVYDDLYAAYLRREDAFQSLIDAYRLPISKASLLEMYRSHFPSISLSVETKELLQQLHGQGIALGLLTDGRSLTQRNKISALQLDDVLAPEAVLISEEFGTTKPNEANYTYFMQLFGAKRYLYVGDNLNKDFIAPNALGWLSVCLVDDGRNIHPQDRTLPDSHQPSVYLDLLAHLPGVINHFLLS